MCCTVCLSRCCCVCLLSLTLQFKGSAQGCAQKSHNCCQPSFQTGVVHNRFSCHCRFMASNCQQLVCMTSQAGTCSWFVCSAHMVTYRAEFLLFLSAQMLLHLRQHYKSFHRKIGAIFNHSCSKCAQISQLNAKSKQNHLCVYVSMTTHLLLKSIRNPKPKPKVWIYLFLPLFKIG